MVNHYCKHHTVHQLWQHFHWHQHIGLIWINKNKIIRFHFMIILLYCLRVLLNKLNQFRLMDHAIDLVCFEKLHFTILHHNFLLIIILF